MATALILGGTGTLGSWLVPLILDRFDRVRVMSRGEHRQMEMAEKLRSSKVDFMVGDVRDKERVRRITEGVDFVFHLAAMKSVDKAEYDPLECKKTTIDGTQNVIEACQKEGVRKAIFTSTDKACSPVTTYGAAKLLAERLWIGGNVGASRTRFSACRYGNVLGSQGSVVEKWKNGFGNVGDPSMTRFWITPKGAAQFVWDRLVGMHGGEVFIPKMGASDVGTLYRACTNQVAPENNSRRVGEKRHELLISEDESDYTTDCGDYYVLWPTSQKFPTEKRGIPILGEVSSKRATQYTVEQLKEMLCS